MNRARYLDPNDPTKKRWKEVWANHYNPEVHGTTLRCKDSQCEAEVCLCDEANIQGSSFSRGIHFITKLDQRDKHHVKCTFVSEEKKNRKRPAKLSESVEKKDILFLINLNIEKRKHRDFGGSSHAKYLSTEYARWCRQNKGKYHTLSVRSAAEYVKTIEKLRRLSGGDDILSRVTVGYRQKIRSFAQFHMATDREKFIRLYNAMRNGHTERKTEESEYEISFPRFIVAKPTNDTKAVLEVMEKEGDDQMMIEANTYTVDVKKRDGVRLELVLMNGIFARSNKNDNADLCRIMREKSMVGIIAVPEMKVRIVKGIQEDFEAAAGTLGKSRKFWPRIKWTVNAKEQFTAVADQMNLAPLPPKNPPASPQCSLFG